MYCSLRLTLLVILFRTPKPTPPTTCKTAGFSSCCTRYGRGCYISAGRCWCDKPCVPTRTSAPIFVQPARLARLVCCGYIVSFIHCATNCCPDTVICYLLCKCICGSITSFAFSVVATVSVYLVPFPILTVTIFRL